MLIESTRVLLLGEGNFSFGLSLSRSLRSSRPARYPRLHCTSFDSATVLATKYPEARHCLNVLASFEDVLIEHGVDATALHRSYSLGPLFDQVVFNFPHLGIEDCRLHASLLAHVFHSVKPFLRPAGSIHISLSKEQCSRWRLSEVRCSRSCCHVCTSHRYLSQMAERQDMVMVQSFAFHPGEFAGYETRRHQNDKSFGARIGESLCCRLARREEADAAAAIESEFWRALCFYRDRATQQPPLHTKRRKTRVCQLTEGKYAPTVDGQFECLECGGKFRSAQGARTHVYMQHVLESATEDIATCDLCGRSFPHRKALREHCKVMHELGAPKKTSENPFHDDTSLVFGCSECDLTFTTAEELQRHLEGIVPVDDKIELLCADCDRRFHDERALTQHRNLAHSSNNIVDVPS